MTEISRASLYQLHSGWHTCAITASICINIGLLLFSDFGLGAQAMYATLEVYEGPSENNGMCSTSTSDSTLMNTTIAEFSQIVYDCVVPNIANLAAFGGCLQTNNGFTSNCTTCFDSSATCITSNCLFQCITGLSSGCIRCSDRNCISDFVDCGGIPMPTDSVHYGESEAEAAAQPTNYWDATEAGRYRPVGPEGDISYVYALRRAWEGEAYLVGIAILVCSGIWPYLSNILFAASWYVPLTPRARSQLLAWTNRFDRWALMDVMVVCVLIALFEFHVAGVHAICEARIAINTFAIAGIQSIVQGTWISRRDATVGRAALTAAAKAELATVDAAHLGCCGSVRAAELERACHSPWMIRVWAAVSAVSLALMIAACGTSVMHKEERRPGLPTAHTEYTLWDIGGLLFSPPHTDEVQGEGVFLALMFAAICVGASLLSLVLIFLGSFAKLFDPTSRPGALLISAANWTTPYAGYDVFAVGLLVMTAEYDKIVGAIVSSITGSDYNDQSNSPLAAHAYADSGAFLMLGSSALLWFTSFIATSVGKADHGIEMGCGVAGQVEMGHVDGKVHSTSAAAKSSAMVATSATSDAA